MTTTSTVTPDRPEDYRDGEGLRTLLRRLHAGGPNVWRRDPVAAELMRYAREKYAPLASKHGLDPWEAASAAFDVMRTRAARTAHDPWAVITHAVRITCIFEERAQGLLCSVHQARRPHVSAFHDPERFSDRENPLTDYHPAFQVVDGIEIGDHMPASEADEEPSTLPLSAAEDAIALLALLGWAPETARGGVEHVCGALMRAGSRATAFERLRRDRQVRILLDIPTGSWHALLRALLGNPDADFAATGAGRGILLRLLIGESIPLLLRDDDLVLSLSLAAPGARR